MGKSVRFAIVAVLAAAAMLLAAAPAGAAADPCPDPYTAYVVNPLTDTLLLAVDLNADGTVCAYLSGDVARAVDNSPLAAFLAIGIPEGWTSIDGTTTIGDVTVTIEDVLDVDQRGNRNNVAAVNICSQNTGNSCFSNNKVLNNAKVIVADDVLVSLP